MITLKLNKTQIPHFIKMIFIAEWVINGIKLKNELNLDVHQCAKKIYQQLYDQNVKKFFSDKDYPNLDIEIKYLQEWLLSVEEFCQEEFWHILAEYLVGRDILLHYSDDELKKLSQEELRQIYFQKLNFYLNEFNENGINNLVVISSLPDNIYHPD